MKTHMNDIPIFPFVDVFAGAGGLGEGFLSFRQDGQARFSAAVSVEKEKVPCDTLVLRHFFHLFPEGHAPADYYTYVSGKMTKEELFSHFPDKAEAARHSVLCWTMEDRTQKGLDRELRARLKDAKRWALIGGPPCQAYSIAGRFRRKRDPDFDSDPRHTLYKQYIHILEGFTPPVFVMENVMGLLSATLSGRFTLELIIRDLLHAGPGYHIYSLSSGEEVSEGSDFRQLVISAEKYGVPQIRKRLFILGIRKDLGLRPLTLSPCRSVTTGEAIGDLSIVRSGITKTIDTLQNWLAAIESIRNNLHGTPDNVRRRLLSRLDQLPSFWEQEHACGHSSSATSFADQMKDPNLNDFPQHLPRKNMPSDLRRYFYAAVYGEITGRSPHLQDFPRNLLPDHKNIRENPGSAVFNDRFRVQLRDKPSSTVTAHIRKDGKNYIHYDPLQCRSLTVREAARLQSFPDNYFLEGNRTEQYQQIGNAVPPLLARKIAAIVADILDRMKWPTS